MIKKLKKRLIITFTLFTSCILLAVVAYSLFDSLGKQKTENIYLRDSSFSAIFSVAPYYENSEMLKMLKEVEESENILVLLKQKDEIVYATENWQGKTSSDELFQIVENMIKKEDTNLESTFGTVQMPELSSEILQSVQEVDNEQVTTEIVEEDYDEGITQGIVTYYNYAIAYPLEDEDSLYSGILIKGNNEDKYIVQGVNVEIMPQQLYFSIPEDVEVSDATETVLEESQAAYSDTPLKTYQLFVFRDPSAENISMIKVVSTYVLLFLGGFVLLLLTNYFLASMAVKPAEESLQKQTEFIAAASHELKNPLAVIRSSIAAAEISDDKKEEQKYLDVVDSEATRMGRLVNELLLLAGGDTGKWKIQMEKVDVDTLLIEAAEQAEMVARKNGVKIVLDLPEEALGEIDGDKDRLHQVLFVLIDNALQYSPAKSTVEIVARGEKNMMKISVIDHGVGIPEAERNRVFERFYRSDTSHSNKNHFGLGLSVASELVEMHNGKIVLEETPQGGATFVVTLPYKNKK